MNRKDRRAAQKHGKGSGRAGGAPFTPAQGLSPAALSANTFAAAVGHFRAGQWDQAARACQDVLMFDPNHADALHLLGMTAHQLGRHDHALELMGKAIARNGRNADSHFNIAQVFRTLGRLDEAIVHLTQATALKRDHAAAHSILGDILMQQGKLAEARAPYERARALDARMLAAHYGLANIAMQQGRFDDAVAAYGHVLALKPDFAEACNNFGVALASLGRWDEAAALYRQALALKPELVDVYRNLGRALLVQGDAAGALALARRGLAVRETEETKGFLVQCARAPQAIPADAAARAELSALVARALEEGWSRPGELSALAAQLFKLSAAGSGCVARALESWPGRLAADDLWGPDGLAPIAGDRLLRALLEAAPVLDVALERFLTLARFALLRLAVSANAGSATDGDGLAFFCALARQCFINEYVFDQSLDESSEAGHLQKLLGDALASDAPVNALVPVAVAAFIPLHSLACAQALLARTWPEPVARLLDQQVREPLAEQAIRGSIRTLSAIEDETSLAVQRQYEEMPYPRWIKPAPVGQPTTIDWYLRNQFSRAPIRGLGPRNPLDVLIAGCGTGQHAIESARRYVGARVLAIDLSRASLAYAARKTQALGLRQIEYAQADILKLGALGASFDVIEATGVLHHLRDPAAGWRVLLSLLRPGGFMHVGLYSALARADVRAARAFIAERGHAPDAGGIRACRQDILAMADGTPLKNVARYPDFFTTSECRDLLFHVQEHQLTIPLIKAFLSANTLAFIGFTGEVAQSYLKRFSDDPAMTDLDRWHQFETEHPASFTGMYQFWVQKPVA